MQPLAPELQHSSRVILKHRFPKTYRHPTLDTQLTRQRLVSESRVLLRAAKAGIRVPALRCLDVDHGILGLELIPGETVRQVLGGGVEGALDQDQLNQQPTRRLNESQQRRLLETIGEVLARLHTANLIHGDLTTSNMILSPSQPASDTQDGDTIVLIDFGLAFSSANVEDKAVDLFVLERAFLSTHPDSQEKSNGILKSLKFETVLQGYRQACHSKAWEAVQRRLDDVRMRGRKRSMVG